MHVVQGCLLSLPSFAEVLYEVLVFLLLLSYFEVLFDDGQNCSVAFDGYVLLVLAPL